MKFGRICRQKIELQQSTRLKNQVAKKQLLPQQAFDISNCYAIGHHHKTIKDCAGLAQLVEQLICNHQVGSSSPPAGTTFIDY